MNKMQTTTKIFILSFLLINILDAQDSLSFFPFHEGDLWQYQDSDGHIYNQTLVSDSTDSLGNHYLEYEIQYITVPGSWTEYWLVDTLSRVWSGKYLYWDFQKKYHEWYYCATDIVGPFYAFIESLTMDRILFRFYHSTASDGSPFKQDSVLFWGGSDSFVRGVGRTYTTSEFYWESLNGAIINGVLHGFIIDDTTAIQRAISELPPKESYIKKLYPNPFNQTIKIQFVLHKSAFVTLEIFDINGRKIKTLINKFLTVQTHQAEWDGKNQFGSDVASGIYLVRLRAGDFSISKRIFLKK